MSIKHIVYAIAITSVACVARSESGTSGADATEDTGDSYAGDDAGDGDDATLVDVSFVSTAGDEDTGDGDGSDEPCGAVEECEGSAVCVDAACCEPGEWNCVCDSDDGCAGVALACSGGLCLPP